MRVRSTDTFSLTLFAIYLATSGCQRENGFPGRTDGGLSDRGVVPSDAELSDHGPVFDAGPIDDDAPPPISGGTLTVLRDGTTAVASDPDRDLVYVVSLATATLTATIALSHGDEPGRVVEGANGRAHVALRRGGAVVTIDASSGTVVDRRAACPAPRGIAYESSTGLLHVACVGGELVSLPEAGGAATRTLHLDDDLRDVIVSNGHLLVSRFRTAELLAVGSDGAVLTRIHPPDLTLPQTVSSMGTPIVPHVSANVAWRAVPIGESRVLLAHQGDTDQEVNTTHGGYGSGTRCGSGSIVDTVLTIVTPGTQSVVSQLTGVAVLPVDVAVSPDGTRFAFASAGSAGAQSSGGSYATGLISDVGANGPCGAAARIGSDAFGQVTAVAFDGGGRLVLQSREPATLSILEAVDTPFEPTGTSFSTTSGPRYTATASIPLSSIHRDDVGHSLFHHATSASIACASCHPEAGDDGHVWTFNGIGRRRTPVVRGGVLGTEPFHWNGDETDFALLMNDVFVNRMAGPAVTNEQIGAVARWVNSQPELPRDVPADRDAVARGEAIFEDPSVGCASCHSGPQLTNNQTMNVATGGAFQVPSLRGVRWRPPYLHGGCAATLQERFTRCGSDQHGHTSQLSPGQIDDLVAYLRSL